MSNYPAQIDTDLPVASDNISPVKSSNFNKLRDSILAVQLSLGINPAGTFSTVANRLTVIENALNVDNQGIRIGGDIGGTNISPTIIGIQGRPIASNAPVPNNSLIWNGVSWAPGFAVQNPNFGSFNITTTGNIFVHNITATGNTDITGNISSVNNITASGNISASNITASGTITAGSINLGTETIAGEVNTIAVLKALSPPTSLIKLFVRGYYAVGDGGGGHFYWDSVATDPDNGGTILQANAGGNGRWRRIFDDAIDVRWFGAKGNGTTDDTVAIQAAITASFSAGRRVLFTTGNYLTTSQITIPEATTLFGIGNPPGGINGTGNGYPTILHHFDGYLFVFNGANGSGVASGGGVEGLRMVQTFGSSGITPRGAAIVFTGSDVDHIVSWAKIRNCIIEETLTNDPWTWGIIMDGTAAAADDGMPNIFMSNVASHTSNAAGGALYLTGVGGPIIDSCQFNLEGNVTITGNPSVDTSATTISNTTMRHLFVDYAHYVSVIGGVVVDITTTANTKFTNTFMPGVLTSTFTDNSGRASGAIWYEPNGLYDPSAGRFRISKSILLPNNELLYGFNAAGDGIIPMIGTDSSNDIVISRTGGHNILLGPVTNLNSAGASDVVIPHNVSFRAQNNAGTDTLNLININNTSNNFIIGDINGGSILFKNNGTTSLTIAGSTITIDTGVTFGTTGTGNINLPNNGSAKFQIEGLPVGSTVTATNLNTLTNGSNADTLHTHSGVTSTQIAIVGLTTTGLADGDFGYFSQANTVSKTDATSMSSSRAVGANEGTSGSMTTNGVVENAKFTTAGGSPSIGAPVYLAPSNEEASASGKLTATRPTTVGQVVAEVGIVIDNANYASLKTSKILLQVKSPIQL